MTTENIYDTLAVLNCQRANITHRMLIGGIIEEMVYTLNRVCDSVCKHDGCVEVCKECDIYRTLNELNTK